MAKVTMPQLGESVAEGTIGKWLKKPGDQVAKYEPLLEVITDKVNAEVPSPFAGVLKEILVEEGATVPNNAEIAVIDTGDEAGAEAGAAAPPPAAAATSGQAAPTEAAPSAPAQPAAKSETAPAPTEDQGSSAPQPAAPGPAPTMAPTPGPAGSDERSLHEMPDRAAAAATPAAPTATAPTTPGEEPRMTPAVRRLLREHGLSASQLVGTGGGGRITREDVINYVEAVRTGQQVGGQGPAPAAAPAGQAVALAQPTPSAGPAAPSAPAPSAPAPSPAAPSAPSLPAFPGGADEQLIPWTQMRKGVATAMLRSKTTIPHAYTTVEVDMTNVVRRRDTVKVEYQAREGVGLSFVPFLIKAVVEALKKHPKLNASWSEEGLVVKRHINVAIAVAVDDGLITPVIHDADLLSISGLNHAVQDLAARARANKLRLEDIQGGTITVNNTGWFGSVASQSIVNPGQIVIVNMESIVKRPVVRETPEGDTIAVRSIMNLPAAFDHRATDGAQVGRFVGDVKAWLESVGPELPIY